MHMKVDRQVTFGWVVSSKASGTQTDAADDPVRLAGKYFEAVERYIEIASPYLDAVWVTDHFQQDKQAVVESMTTLGWLIGRHLRPHFGHMVLCQSYRNPALVAKMAANLQTLSGGRYILGMGAGWHEQEYRAYGYDFPPAAVRIAQLEEAVQIIRALWTQSPANFEGKYYRIVNAECVPQPDPPIPIMIGGGGEKRMLRVVARHADWWNHNFCTPEEYAHKQRVLAGHCHEVGRDPHSIVYTYDTMLNITAHPADAGEPRDKGTYIISGTPDTVTRQLEAFVRLGVRHFQLRFLDFPSTRGLELFAEKVLPRLRAE